MMRDMSATIVWIHGFPLSPAIFEKQRAIDGVQHVMPPLPGFGGAAPPQGSMSMDEYARGILAAMPHGKAIFAGLSMGGYICFSIARLAPERMSGLILIDTRATADNDEQRAGRYTTIEKVRAANSVEAVVEAMLPKMLTSDAPEEMRRRVREIMSASSTEGVIFALEAMAQRADSAELLPRIDVPALVVVGSDDPITPPSNAEEMARAIPNATLVNIPGAAHLANYEQWERFNGAVTSFIATSGDRT